ncbi:SLAP domain-containing protein [Clostridium botulinum]
MKLSKKIIAITIMCASISLCSTNITVNAADKKDTNLSYTKTQTEINRMIPVAYRWMVRITGESGAIVYDNPGGGHQLRKLSKGTTIRYAGETREVNGEKWYKISDRGWVSARYARLYKMLI